MNFCNRVNIGALIALALVLSSVGCAAKNITLVPGAVNSTDQYLYQTLTVAQAGLNTARVEVRDHYPQYKAEYNQVASSYNTLQDAYKVYHNAAVKGDTSAQAQLSANITQLVGDLAVLLEKVGVTGTPTPLPPLKE